MDENIGKTLDKIPGMGGVASAFYDGGQKNMPKMQLGRLLQSMQRILDR